MRFPLRRLVAGVAVLVLVGGGASARPETPEASDTNRISLSGNYLAGRLAGVLRDNSSASTYFRAALKADPRNAELAERTFLVLLASGEIEEAGALAERLLQVDRQHRIARLVLAVRAIKARQYQVARVQLGQTVRGPINDLTATLLSAWTALGAGDAKTAIELVDKLQGPDWYATFRDLHAGLILDIAGNRADAGKRFERAYKVDATALRVVDAFARWSSRTDGAPAGEDVRTVQRRLQELGYRPGPVDGVVGPKTRAAIAAFQADKGLKPDGRLDGEVLRALSPATARAREEALRLYAEFEKVLPRHPLVEEAVAQLKAGTPLAPSVRTVQEGAAEVLYGLGAALGRQGGEDLGLVYLQLALHLVPEHPLALLSLADLYEALKKPELAIEVYERVPDGSALKRNAEIQLGLNLDQLDRTGEARKHLERIVATAPDDLEAVMALANVLRGRKQFEEAADIYSKAIAKLAPPERRHWMMFYFRGICYERSKRWPLAEADFKTALELYPDQPHVLNYLGYSWVDQGVNLDRALDMVKRAVTLRPDDGYIVDSLGWAYYRLGRYDDAVVELERAVELKPDDPVINDHLGDAYWKVGRRLEAMFQWAHARDLKPEPEDLARIEGKLKVGLRDSPLPKAEVEIKPNGG